MNTSTNQVQAQTSTNIVTVLRQEAARSKVFNNVCRLFANRQRSRAQVTIHSLHASMHKQGLVYTKQELMEVLRFLADLGVGRLDLNRNNKIRALKDIKITLQSIGETALSKSSHLTNKAAKNKFNSLYNIIPSPEPKVDHPAEFTEEDLTVRHPAELTVKFSKNEIATFPIPKGITAKDLGLLLTQLYAK